jgi:1-acyl-sn-glycerol-3-phosphate acyltransferase
MIKKIIWLPYRIYILCIFFITLLIAFSLIMACQLLPESIKSQTIFKINCAWTKFVFICFFIKLQVSGKENVNQNESVIFIANHRSYLDAALIFLAIPKYFKPLGKAEMGKIPIFGPIYKSVAISVDRSSPFNRARSVKLLKRQILRGTSIVMFPEGTFNMGNEPLIDFYDGAFRIAIETQTDIQPFIITGTQQVLDRFSAIAITPGFIKVKYLPIISVKGLKWTDTEMLKKKAYQQIKEALLAEGNW